MLTHGSSGTLIISGAKKAATRFKLAVLMVPYSCVHFCFPSFRPSLSKKDSLVSPLTTLILRTYICEAWVKGTIYSTSASNNRRWNVEIHCMAGGDKDGW
jgi:hypothetical protein